MLFTGFTKYWLNAACFVCLRGFLVRTHGQIIIGRAITAISHIRFCSVKPIHSGMETSERTIRRADSSSSKDFRVWGFQHIKPERRPNMSTTNSYDLVHRHHHQVRWYPRVTHKCACIHRQGRILVLTQGKHRLREIRVLRRHDLAM